MGTGVALRDALAIGTGVGRCDALAMGTGVALADGAVAALAAVQPVISPSPAAPASIQAAQARVRLLLNSMFPPRGTLTGRSTDGATKSCAVAAATFHLGHPYTHVRETEKEGVRGGTW